MFCGIWCYFVCCVCQGPYTFVCTSILFPKFVCMTSKATFFFICLYMLWVQTDEIFNTVETWFVYLSVMVTKWQVFQCIFILIATIFHHLLLIMSVCLLQTPNWESLALMLASLTCCLHLQEIRARKWRVVQFAKVKVDIKDSCFAIRNQN